MYPQTSLLVVGKAPLGGQALDKVTEELADRVTSQRDPCLGLAGGFG